MKKFLATTCSALLAASMLITASLPASAGGRYRHHSRDGDVLVGVIGGMILGGLAAQALTGPRVYYCYGYGCSRYYRRYPPYYYDPYPPYYGGRVIYRHQYVPRRVYRSLGPAHYRWCHRRYRSYRSWDNTFQPYHGPRRPCYSPYS